MTPPDQVRSEVRLVAMERTEHGDFKFGNRVEVRTPELTAAWDAGITEEDAKFIAAHGASLITELGRKFLSPFKDS